MCTINYYSIQGRPRGGSVKPHSHWGFALEDLYKAPRGARIATVDINGNIRRYERTPSNGWRRTV